MGREPLVRVSVAEVNDSVVPPLFNEERRTEGRRERKTVGRWGGKDERRTEERRKQKERKE